MWERLAASGALLTGALMLFAVFTTALMIIEKREQKCRYKRLGSLRNRENQPFSLNSSEKL